MTNTLHRLRAVTSDSDVQELKGRIAAVERDAGKAVAAIAANRARLRHLPSRLSSETLSAIVARLGLSIAAAASGTVDVKDLDVALSMTGLSVADRIRLKTLLTR
jgi:hypothetical protein